MRLFVEPEISQPAGRPAGYLGSTDIDSDAMRDHLFNVLGLNFLPVGDHYVGAYDVPAEGGCSLVLQARPEGQNPGYVFTLAMLRQPDESIVDVYKQKVATALKSFKA